MSVSHLVFGMNIRVPDCICCVVSVCKMEEKCQTGLELSLGICFFLDLIDADSPF